MTRRKPAAAAGAGLGGRVAGNPPDLGAIAQAADQVFAHATGFIVSSALHVAVTLGIPDLLAGRPLNALELSELTATEPTAMAPLLRTLAGAGFLQQDGDGRYRPTTAGALLCEDAAISLKPFVAWIANPFHLRTYAELLFSVRTGRDAVEKVFRSPIFSLFEHDRELADEFNLSMTVFGDAPASSVLAAYDFGGIGTLVDVGGAHGHLLTAILERYPALTGIVLDIEPMLQGARERVQARGLGGRCRTIAADFFAALPRGDAYLLKQIVHDWSDEKALRILRNVREALGDTPDGRVLVIERMVLAAAGAQATERMQLEMLAVHGGRERTEAEYRALLERARFEVTRIIPLESGLHVIEGKARGVAAFS